MSKPLRLPVRTPGTTATAELDGFDRFELDALDGAYDPADPHDWPDELQEAARSNWPGGPEAFDAWLATYDDDDSLVAAGFNPSQPRDDHGRWGGGSGGEAVTAALTVTWREKGTIGNSTHITLEEEGTVPTSAIANLLGVMGEEPGQHRNRQGAAWEAFKADVAANGITDPIFIVMDYDKQPKISEGNHRRDAAVELGLTEVPVQIRYFGHAEQQGRLMERTDTLVAAGFNPSQPRDDHGRWGGGTGAEATTAGQVAEPDSGFTSSVPGLQPVTAGFAVALAGSDRLSVSADAFVDGKPTREMIVALRERIKAAMRTNVPGATMAVGGWHNPDDGLIEVNVTAVFPPHAEAEARAFAVANDQIAMFSLHDGETIATGGTGGDDREKKRAALRVALDATVRTPMSQHVAHVAIPDDFLDWSEEDQDAWTERALVAIAGGDPVAASGGLTMCAAHGQFACHSPACRPPGSGGTGGSNPGGGGGGHDDALRELIVALEAEMGDDADAFLDSLGEPEPGEELFAYQSRALKGVSPAIKHAVLARVRERPAPVAEIRDGMNDYLDDHGLPHPKVDFHTITADLDKSARIVAAIQATHRDANNPEFQAAYDDFKRQSDMMWDHMTAPVSEGGMGIIVEEWDERVTGVDDPYHTSAEQSADVAENSRIKINRGAFFIGSGKPPTGSNHPFMTDDEYFRFRAVHDLFGHVAVGTGFDRHGEYAAWVAHNAMYTGEGRKAMSTEYHAVNTHLWATGVPMPPDRWGIVLPDDVIETVFDADGNVVRT